MEQLSHQGRALVVYESMFGDTRAIANAIAAGLLSHFGRVDVVGADAAPADLGGVDLVIVGAPTHAFRLPRPSSRAAARARGAEAVAERGVREWLEALQVPEHSVAAAAFDTHAQGPMPGAARHSIARRLRGLGMQVAASKGFAVTRTEGPLADGSLQAARRWGTTFDPAGFSAARV